MRPVILRYVNGNQCLICMRYSDDIKIRETNMFSDLGYQYCTLCAPKVEEDTVPYAEVLEKYDVPNGHRPLGAAYRKKSVVDILKNRWQVKTVKIRPKVV